jgi:NAD(P)-dependent dehydrogenase (short-subunit alcohol dehydrogenase family)
MMDMSGKTVLITGAAGGIGTATARVFALAGANLVLSDLTSACLESGTHTLALSCDVTDPASVQAMVQAGVDRFGKIDVAINNAGISGPRGRFTDTSIEQWNQLVSVNLSGVFHCLQAEIAAMSKTGGGRIINLASLAGVSGSPGLAAYGATKHGVVGLTKSLAHELARDNIRVNALCPSYIDTPMLQDVTQDTDRLHSDLNTLGRFGTPQEIADALLWMASPENSFMNGQAIVLDGGISAV